MVALQFRNCIPLRLPCCSFGNTTDRRRERSTRVAFVPRATVVLRHQPANAVELAGDARRFTDVPQRALLESQAQNNSVPGRPPARLGAPGAPAQITRARPVIPPAIVERAKPRPVD